MKYIKLWGTLYKIHRETSSTSILRQNGHHLTFYAGLFLYFCSSIIALYFHRSYFLSATLSIFCVAALIKSMFLYTLARDYKEILHAHPFFSKAKYIKLIEFKKRFDESPELSDQLIPSLIEWEEIRNRKFDTINLLTNPITLIFLSVILQQLFQKIGPGESGLNYIIFFSYIFMSVMFVSWTTYDFITSDKKRNFEIARLLHWMEIEHKSEQ